MSLRIAVEILVPVLYADLGSAKAFIFRQRLFVGAGASVQLADRCNHAAPLPRRDEWVFPVQFEVRPIQLDEELVKGDTGASPRELRAALVDRQNQLLDLALHHDLESAMRHSTADRSITRQAIEEVLAIEHLIGGEGLVAKLLNAKELGDAV
jgi:hypothetical protein